MKCNCLHATVSNNLMKVCQRLRIINLFRVNIKTESIRRSYGIIQRPSKDENCLSTVGLATTAYENRFTLFTLEFWLIIALCYQSKWICSLYKSMQFCAIGWLFASGPMDYNYINVANYDVFTGVMISIETGLTSINTGDLRATGKLIFVWMNSQSIVWKPFPQ